MVRIAPSLLAADFAALGSEARKAEEGGADLLHVDVMDGHFVPNITFGPAAVEAVRRHTRLVLDVHLMIEKPEQYISAFAAAGADIITVHAEACTHLHRTLQVIREHGKRAGVALNPATPLSALDHVLGDVDLVLLMSVNPGFGGQDFLPLVLPKLHDLRLRLDALPAGRGGMVEVEVDGGITPATAGPAFRAGATILVAGSAVFGETDVSLAIARLRQACLDPA